MSASDSTPGAPVSDPASSSNQTNPPGRRPALVRLRVAQSGRWKSASGRSSPPVTEGTALE